MTKEQLFQERKAFIAQSKRELKSKEEYILKISEDQRIDSIQLVHDLNNLPYFKTPKTQEKGALKKQIRCENLVPEEVEFCLSK